VRVHGLRVNQRSDLMHLIFWEKVLYLATAWGLAWIIVCLKFFHMTLSEAVSDTWWRALCFALITTALYTG